MATNLAALVWGVPVHIIDLLDTLDLFRREMPTVNALRLCHRFGTGEQAHITKLPRELLALVEHEYMKVRRERDWSAWSGKYCCFEGSCRPSHHVYDDRYLDLREEALEIVCEEHNINSDLDFAMFDMPSDISDLVAVKADELCAHHDGIFEGMLESQFDWPRWVSQGPSGGFRPYNELLCKHFGLEAFIMHESLDAVAGGYISRNDKRFLKNRPLPVQATICYLVLPAKVVSFGVQMEHQMMATLVGISGKSVLVAPESLHLDEAHRKRFSRALNVLNLQPSVHPSQLGDTLSAFSPDHSCSNLHEDTASTANDDVTPDLEKRDAATVHRIKELEQSPWPKLMFLFKEEVDLEG